MGPDANIVCNYLERGQSTPWLPALDAALLASAMRWLIAALLLAGLVWLVHRALGKRVKSDG